MSAERSLQSVVLKGEDGNVVAIVLDGSVYRVETQGKILNSSGTQIDPSTEGTLATRASETTLAAADTKLGTIDSVLDSIKDTDGIKKITDPLPAGTNNIGDVDVVSSALPTGAATEATLATLATEAKLEAVRVLLASLDAKDYATQTTLASILTDTGQIEALLATIDADTSNLDVALSTRATEATLSAADTKLGTIDAVLDSIKDVDGIKKITDALPTGTNTLGDVGLQDTTHGKDAAFSAFAELKTTTNAVVQDLRFTGSELRKKWETTTTDAGSVDVLSGGNGVDLTTGASATSIATIKSQIPLRYAAGRGQIAKFSIILTDAGVANNTREWGLQSATAADGIFLRMDGTTLKLIHKSNGVETEYAASAWDTPVTPDANGHLWYIQYQWLGVGNIYLYYDEALVHTVSFLGTSTALSLGDPDLFAYLCNENTTNATNVTLRSGCVLLSTETAGLTHGQDDTGQLRTLSVDDQGKLGVQIRDSTGPVKVVRDGGEELAVRDDESLSLLRMLIDEIRTLRLMFGHASELGFDTEDSG